MRALVLTFDHLALNCLGCYGNTWIETPHLDRLAAQSVVFDNCYTPDISAVLSNSARRPGGRAPRFRGPEVTALIEVLRAGGVRTTLCRERDSGSIAGTAFEEVCDTGGSIAADAPNRERPCARLMAAAADCWRRQAHSSEPWLLWIASQGVPTPWLPPREIAGIYWEEFLDARTLQLTLAAAAGTESSSVGREAGLDPEQSLSGALEQLAANGFLCRGVVPELDEFQAVNRMIYAAYVSAIDAWLGTLLDAVGHAPADDLLLIVAAAAGDLLTRHPCVERGCPPIVDALVHVPLLVRRGSGEPVGTRRNGLVSTADIRATLAAWFQLSPGGAWGDSHDLLPMVHCNADAVRDDMVFGAEGIGWGVRTTRYACLCAEEHDSADGHPRLGRPWLFAKPDDAADCLDVVDQNPRIAESLAARVSSATGIDPGPASASTRLAAP